MGMSTRRLARLTSAFSKRPENHVAATAPHCMCYNLVRIHRIPRVTPAMQAGFVEHVWSIEELVALLGH
jgi:hypothetical protein